MKTILTTMLLCAASAFAGAPDAEPAAKPQSAPLANPRIDYPQAREIAAKVAPVREQRRVTEEQFAAMAAEKGTVVLDARSADKYAMLRVEGAVNLPFTEFTAQKLAQVIPEKTTRVLIYCNNNFRGNEPAVRTKAPAASLNISTQVALATYGYQQVYELAPLLDVKTAKLPLTGTQAPAPAPTK